ncbi:hypothetical protein ACFE04_024846 [Oxalis oulophora]
MTIANTLLRRPNRKTIQILEKIISSLQSCKKSSETAQIHGYVIKTGLDHNPFILSKLLASSIHDTQYAASIFHHVQTPNLFMFNTMLRAYSISQNPNLAFAVFNNLRSQGFIMLDQFSFVTTLKACTRESAIWVALGIHGVILKSGFLLFLNLKNTLLHFYCVCGRIGDAHKLFDEFPRGNDVVSWNTLMGGYVHVRQPEVAIDLFREFCRNGFELSAATMLNCLNAVGDVGDSVVGQCLHGHCLKIGLLSKLNVVTALIDMYTKTAYIDLARRIFDEVGDKDIVLWNCMIDRYAKSEMIEEAVDLLQSMKNEGLTPNSSTLAGLLSACGAYSALGIGRFLGDYIEEKGLRLDAILGTALVDMYAKCGCLVKAIDVFEKIDNKDVTSWTAMISGYGVHGQARNAIELFERMVERGFKPNSVSFLAVLSACSHGRLVMEGMEYFRRMVEEYGDQPTVEHYGCVIDLLGRAGMLQEAHDLIKSLPTKTDAIAWRTLLAACRNYGNIKLGEHVKKVLVEIDNEHPTDSILLSGTYAIAGRLPDHEMQSHKKEEKIKDLGRSMLAGKNEENIVKEVGISMIE